eukprot:TRINITY_DN21740_c0_g1_i1.p1 TRINITY_DN21740_c0_g1~~TRINITY_DN21740_c0_g1_i1.p1  ORF type:complete len:168 (-),score=44.62 TRINITY_DN21740_c0_g1_i1:295-798(-)
MSFNDNISVLKDGGFPLCGCLCSECSVNGGPTFALSAKACCCSVGIGFKAAAAAAAAALAAKEATDSKAAAAAAAVSAAGLVDSMDDSQFDVNFCDECWSTERGMCEIVFKLLCCYAELQCPPGKDIGCACCGLRCLDGDNSVFARERAEGSGYYLRVEDAPQQQTM